MTTPKRIKCNKCHVTKTYVCYTVDRSRPTGRSGICRKCAHILRGKPKPQKLVRISPEQAREIRKLYNAGTTGMKLAEVYGVTPQRIYQITSETGYTNYTRYKEGDPLPELAPVVEHIQKQREIIGRAVVTRLPENLQDLITERYKAGVAREKTMITYAQLDKYLGVRVRQLVCKRIKRHEIAKPNFGEAGQ